MAQARSPVLNRPGGSWLAAPYFSQWNESWLCFLCFCFECFYKIMTDLATLIDKPVATRTRYLSDDVQDCLFPCLFVWLEEGGKNTILTLLQSVSFSELKFILLNFSTTTWSFSFIYCPIWFSFRLLDDTNLLKIFEGRFLSAVFWSYTKECTCKPDMMRIVFVGGSGKSHILSSVSPQHRLSLHHGTSSLIEEEHQPPRSSSPCPFSHIFTHKNRSLNPLKECWPHVWSNKKYL